MKITSVLPLVAFATAFVIPDEQVMSQLSIESHKPADSVFDRLPSKDQLIGEFQNTFSRVVKSSKNAFDEAFEIATETGNTVSQRIEESVFDTKSWLDTAYTSINDLGKHGRHGHHGHYGKPNQTVYELIAGSKYTTKLAALISEYDDLVELLNGTTANFTVFAPIDKAFEKIPEHAPKPSKEFLKKVLTYHISSEFYPAGRVLVTHTIPTLLEGESLGGEAQRLSTNIGLRGLTVNFYSRIIAIDIFGTNGVIHGVESILIPPPKTVDIISFLPGEFSTLELGLGKTGLITALNDTTSHVGGTLFAPSNFAFQKLGPRINGFLFSRYGQKYLKALLKYHVVANQTLYSDAYYKADKVEEATIPKGLFHVDLPTLLCDRSLSIDVARFGRIITIKINGFSDVTIEDGIAKDGVIHVVSNVLIPPKQVGGMNIQWQGEELTEEDLKDRLDPFMGNDEL
ncbi:hypothetical protein MMC12_005471 [Toensbergia leucococca]|nr:hypothetical protein [Toensbergia leucococca]